MCNLYSLAHHFYVVKLGFIGVYILPYFCSKTKILGACFYRLTEAVLICTHNLCVKKKIRNISHLLHVKIFIFTAIKTHKILH